jgi:hypothetical protein
MRLLAIVAAAACIALAGCGGGGEREPESTVAAGGCAASGAATLPAVFPEDVPRPDGLRVSDVHQDGDYTVAEGSAAGSLEDVRDFFQTELPKAGFELGEGDAEEHEAETEFEANGVRGKLKLNDISGCSDRVAVQLAVAGD